MHQQLHVVFDNAYFCAQMLEVYFVQWAVGLNPYNYLQECFGGAPDLQIDDEKPVSLTFPDAALFHGDLFERYVKVKDASYYNSMQHATSIEHLLNICICCYVYEVPYTCNVCSVSQVVHDLFVHTVLQTCDVITRRLRIDTMYGHK